MKTKDIRFLKIFYPQNNVIINCNIDENNFFIDNIKIHKVKNGEVFENHVCLGDDCPLCVENIKQDANIYPVYEYYVIPIILYPDSLYENKNRNSNTENNVNAVLLLDSVNYSDFINYLNELGYYSKLFIGKIIKNLLNYNLVKNNITDLNDNEKLNEYINNSNKFYFNFMSLFKRNNKSLQITFNNAKKIEVKLVDNIHSDIALLYDNYTKEDVRDYILRVFFKVKNYSNIKNNS